MRSGLVSRLRLAAAAATAGVALAACGPATLPESSDVVFVSAGARMIALDARTGRWILSAEYAVPTFDWTAVFVAESAGGFTRLVRQEVSSGARRDVARVPGGLVPRVASGSGRLVALTTPHQGASWTPTPRVRTDLAVANLEKDVRRFRWAGNFEPEAFTTDDRTLVLVEYLPPLAPDRYRLRELDLATGVVRALGVRVKRFAPDEMRGTGHAQVPAADGHVLYTLYTRQGPNLAHASGGRAPAAEPVHAFVHVLNLAEGFAHCVDLPRGFGAGPSSVALSSDGRTLFAVDAEHIVAVDTGSFRVAREVQLAVGRPTAIVAATTRGRLFVGAGRQIVVLDEVTLRTLMRRRMPREVTGISPSPDGRRLYVALGDEVAVLDPATGVQIDRIRVAGVGAILHASIAREH